MPIPTPFHERTSKLCTSMRWKDWAGYYAVCSYGERHEPEYFAIRHGAGLIDVSPLFKYEITGRDAARFLARVTVRNIPKLKVGRMTYLCWCDDDGRVVDDGTVARLDESHYRLTSAEPSLAWLERFRRGYDVTIEDSSLRLGALALQGPTSRDILKQVADVDMDGLKFFGIARGSADGIGVWISRTGYTGDLGYEIWVEREEAVRLHDLLMAAGRPYDLLPAGLDAMDVSRVEAGFIMNGVDYFSSHHCLIESRKSSPYELGLGWTVALDREPFVGQRALRSEKKSGPKRILLGLEVDWNELESLYDEFGLPPEIPTSAWRDGRPVYDEGGRWIGQATSGAWSPTLKKNLALVQLQAPFAQTGRTVRFEMTVEYRRRTVSATLVKTPFFDPPRKRA